jgi:hypothetical protein
VFYIENKVKNPYHSIIEFCTDEFENKKMKQYAIKTASSDELLKLNKELCDYLAYECEEDGQMASQTTRNNTSIRGGKMQQPSSKKTNILIRNNIFNGTKIYLKYSGVMNEMIVKDASNLLVQFKDKDMSLNEAASTISRGKPISTQYTYLYLDEKEECKIK